MNAVGQRLRRAETRAGDAAINGTGDFLHRLSIAACGAETILELWRSTASPTDDLHLDDKTDR